MDKGSGISTPATRIRSPIYGAHWSAPNHIFGETTAVGVSQAKSDYDYNYKLSYKFGKKIRNWSAKTFWWVDHLCTRLLLVQTHPTQKYHLCTWLLLVPKFQTQTTNTTNVIFKTRRKSAKIVRTRGSGVRTIRRGTAQDVPCFYTPSNLSELKIFKSIPSTNFPFIFIFK